MIFLQVFFFNVYGNVMFPYELSKMIFDLGQFTQSHSRLPHTCKCEVIRELQVALFLSQLATREISVRHKRGIIHMTPHMLGVYTIFPFPHDIQ